MLQLLITEVFHFCLDTQCSLKIPFTCDFNVLCVCIRKEYAELIINLLLLMSLLAINCVNIR